MVSIVKKGDCNIGMKGFPDKFFDLALCDIPYGLNVAKMPFTRELNTMVTQRNGTKLNGNRQKKVYAQKEWDTKPPSQEYFDELVRVSKVQIIFGVEYEIFCYKCGRSLQML